MPSSCSRSKASSGACAPWLPAQRQVPGPPPVAAFVGQWFIRPGVVDRRRLRPLPEPNVVVGRHPEQGREFSLYVVLPPAVYPRPAAGVLRLLFLHLVAEHDPRLVVVGPALDLVRLDLRSVPRAVRPQDPAWRGRHVVRHHSYRRPGGPVDDEEERSDRLLHTAIPRWDEPTTDR